MKIKTLALLLLTSSLALSNAYADHLTILKIHSTPTDNEKHEFNLSIEMNLQQSLSSSWAIGFYMPRTYNQLGSSINPNLTMQLINDDTGRHIALHYVKANGQNKIYGAGYTNVLAPNEGRALAAGHYTLELDNNNQFAPGNISAMPQHIFFADYADSESPQLYTSIAAKDVYQIGGYDEQAVKAAISAQMAKQRQQSLAVNKKRLVNRLHLVPQPQLTLALPSPGFNVSQDAVLTNYPLVTLKIAALDKNIIFKPCPLIRNPEGYKLVVASNHIFIFANTQAGKFYALQTLHQLLFYAKYHRHIIPALIIKDAPRFKYRGVLLDLARHVFFNKIAKLAYIENFINLMAAQKLNTLHIHFSDDEAWRLALDNIIVDGQKPLTDVAQRRGFVVGSTQPAMMFQQANLDKSNYDNQDVNSGMLIKLLYPNADDLYQGTFSESDIQQLIQYANARQITIIPEIDLPGHARALKQALPSFENSEDQSQYISVQGYYNDVVPVCRYNQANRFTQQMNRVISTIAQWFQSQNTLYAINNEVSVGGDEVSDDAWTNDSSCQNTAYAGLSALDKSHLFFQQLQQNTAIKLSGWQQAVQPLGEQSVKNTKSGHIWVWEPTDSGIADANKLLAANYPVVLAFADDTYFDLAYDPSEWEPGFSWATAYGNTFSALKIALDAGKVQNPQQVLGVESALWSENINNYRHLIYMAMPKMSGFAEAAWSPAQRTAVNGKIDWLSLVNRLGETKQSHGFLQFMQQYYLGENTYRGYPQAMAGALQ